MKSNINKLLEKYWEGETSSAEEEELRNLLSKAEGFEEEKSFFGDIKKFSQVKNEKIQLPRLGSGRYFWIKIAAVLLFFLIATTAIQRYQVSKAEEAYLAVMEAFTLINDNMQKGTSQLEAMEEFRFLNTSHDMFNLKELQK